MEKADAKTAIIVGCFLIWFGIFFCTMMIFGAESFVPKAFFVLSVIGGGWRLVQWGLSHDGRE